MRIYYEDTDHGGIVYNANYLKFMERCRTEFLRVQGLAQQKLIDEEDLIFAVTRVEFDFLKPAKFDDLLIVTSKLTPKSRVQMIFHQAVYLVDEENYPSAMTGYFSKPEDLTTANNERKLLCKAEVTIASLSAAKFKPKRMPETIFKELMREH